MNRKNLYDAQIEQHIQKHYPKKRTTSNNMDDYQIDSEDSDMREYYKQEVKQRMWDRKSKGLKPIVDHPNNKAHQNDQDCGIPQAAFENATGKKRRNKVVIRDQSENVLYNPSEQEKKFEQKFKYHEKQANNNWRIFRQIEK